MKCKQRKIEPVLIGEIMKDYLKDVNRRRQMQKILETVGAKRNEHNRSSLRRVAATERSLP